jgi:serine/threonine-protein kinase
MFSSLASEPIGAYEIEQELGRGAHGVVYRAHHRDRPEQPLAVKVVESRGNLDRLLLEPAVLARLDHPCIVRLEDYFLRGEQLVLALEFIEGEDLQTLLDAGHAFSQAAVRDLLVQIGSALAEAHAKSVIHRDLKPSNILRVHAGGRQRFVLTDFGIGQLAEGIQLQKHTGGTYAYMAPEQLRGRPCPQSDLWALGVVAYRLLTGRMPFPGQTLSELSHEILYAPPAPLQQASTDTIDPQLEAVVLRLLDKSLQERLASAEELLRQLGHRGSLDQVLTQRPSRPAPAGSVSLERKLARDIRVRQVLLVVCGLLYFLPSGVAAGVFLLGGLALFYRAQREERWSPTRLALCTLAAFALLVGFNAFRYFVPEHDFTIAPLVQWFLRFITSLKGLLGEWLGGPGVGSIIVDVVVIIVFAIGYLAYVLLPVILSTLYASRRRLQREQLVHNAAREDGTGSDRYLEALRSALDSRFEDVGLHLKYAEALFARGRIKDAAVEARLLLLQDPYHFNGNLLLANAYHALGLYDEAVALCDRYLEVSGYCFEFSELREQCQRRRGRA